MSTPELTLIKETLKRAPFVIFSKEAPDTLPLYNTDTDFTYHFFNDNMDSLSGISPQFLTENNHNAKTDFPLDYEQYFADDAAVCQEYPFPKVKVITEPWTTPAMVTILETRKTTMVHDDQKYMLGCFGPHDDIELGITSFRATRKLPPALDSLTNVTDTWYEAAFKQLPFATTLVDVAEDGTIGTSTVIAANELAVADTRMVWKSLLEPILSKLPDFDSYEIGTDTQRAWIWRPEPSRPSVVAIAVRDKHIVNPKEVAEKLIC
mmetsp:Transcript_20148/g.19393  ORF Transcript_20148/g.19393 Transcript_20148/m.19393 type:complete len:264 (-) Transcript_20148:371-1162(-)